MTNMIPSFGFSHPFWAQAIELRKSNHTYVEIAQIATESGYPMAAVTVSKGLAKAPVNLQLPATTSRFLRKRYDELEKSFDARVSMRDLAQEALVKAGEIEEELLDDENLTQSRRHILETARDRWYKTAFDWAEKCARLDIDIGTLAATLAANTRPVVNPKDSIKEEENNKQAIIEGEVVRQILDEFNLHLPQVSEESLQKRFGGDNIRISPDGKDDDTGDDF